MSTEPIIPTVSELHYREAQSKRTVRSATLTRMAMLADVCALQRPTRRGMVQPFVSGSAFTLGYRRQSVDIEALYVAAYYRSTASTAGEQLTVSLTITDALGSSVGPTGTAIPQGFQGGVIATVGAGRGPVDALLADGWLPLDTIAATLTDPDWSLAFTFTRPSGTNVTPDRVEIWEAPRGETDSTDTYGQHLGSVEAGDPIASGSVTQDGFARLQKTIEGGITANRSYLSLAEWPNDTAFATIPRTTSATFAALTDLEESTGVAIKFKVRVRPVYATASATGEVSRVRFRYLVSGGGTARFKSYAASGITTLSAETGDLTSASWAWSPWTTVNLPTDAADKTVQLYLEGKTTAGTLYLAAIQWEEHIT